MSKVIVQCCSRPTIGAWRVSTTTFVRVTADNSPSCFGNEVIFSPRGLMSREPVSLGRPALQHAPSHTIAQVHLRYLKTSSLRLLIDLLQPDHSLIILVLISSTTLGVTVPVTMHTSGLQILATALTAVGVNGHTLWSRQDTDYQALVSSLSSTAKVFYTGSDDFNNITTRWSNLDMPTVNVVVRPTTENDVVETVRRMVNFLSYFLSTFPH